MVNQSIKSFTLDDVVMINILDKMPLKILFTSQSNLENFTLSNNCISCYCSNEYHNVFIPHDNIPIVFNEFDKIYANLKQKKQIKILENFYYHFDCDYFPQQIETRHLFIKMANRKWKNYNFLSHTRRLTCIGYFDVGHLD